MTPFWSLWTDKDGRGFGGVSAEDIRGRCPARFQHQWRGTYSVARPKFNSRRRIFPACQTSNTTTDAMALDRVNGKEELFVGG